MRPTLPLDENKSPEEIEDVLIDKGYESLGRGNFSAVYAKPGSSTVIRIGDNDDAWPQYARVCMKQTNPHFPRIERIGTRHGVLVARMERLYPLKDPKLVTENTPLLAFISIFITQAFRDRTAHWDYTMLRLIFVQSLEKRSDFSDAKFRAWADGEAMKCPRPLAQALMTIGTIQDIQDYDFKPDNFMQRADGTLIITDPIW
ncbi:MAG: hypothetical protein EOP83_16870 [Verrucomicrobiaceae bacterium]|nr:MAG: hypothetical protein EOP83_16870 [Verrucomicrobiaceae bacterium]